MQISEQEMRSLAATTEPISPPVQPELLAPEELSPPPEDVLSSTKPVDALDRLPYLVRLGSLHSLLVPVFLGAALAWWQLATFNPWVLLLSLLGGSTLYLSTNAFVAYFDHYRNEEHSRQRGQPPQPDLLITPEPSSVYLTNWGDVLSVAWLLLIFGGLTGLWLAYVAGWPVLFFGGLSAALALAYALPPIQFGYRAGVFGELGLLAAFGYLPTLTSFFAQSSTLTRLPLLAGIPIALLVTLILLHYELISWRQDWRIRKRTSAVTLPPQFVLDIGVGVVAVAFVGILVMVGTNLLPAWALLGLAPLPLALGPYSSIQRGHSTYKESVQLLQATIATVASTGLLLILALWLDRAF